MYKHMCVFCHGADGNGGGNGSGSGGELEAWVKRMDALVVGPGLGRAPGVAMRAWALRTANNNERAATAGGVGSAPPWLLPKIHNAPACLG